MPLPWTAPSTRHTTPNSKYRYFAGTLKYTTGSLFMLFFWMLLGSFFFSLTERLIPVLMPLSLRAFDCSNQTIGLVVGSVPSVLNIIINPWISFRSDRTRSKWGRGFRILQWRRRL